eukprot:TRINITY_DN12180_c0_g1_i1.p1 TRINITY_DN12180_c0_g1~~TRINITY_DN12180_c0_g1_i1.p1  ORF type:complete len:502 (+),score=178.01 TRINITY_DN12180_c0_g1_i1:101-1507(+)
MLGGAPPGRQAQWDGGRAPAWRAAPVLVLVVGVFALAVSMSLTQSAAPHAAPGDAPRGGLFLRSEVRYVTFEPWNGGWNNRRMSLELAFLIALKTNRTLVLPPVRRVAKLPGVSGYESFFSLSVMRRFVPVLTWDEFGALLPHLHPSPGASPSSAECKYRMPNPRGFCEAALPLRRKAFLVTWDFLKIVIPWPRSPRSASAQRELLQYAPRKKDYSAEFLGLERETIVHFPQNLFGLFYTVFYYADAALRQHFWRSVRDGLQLLPPLRERARRMVRKIGGEFACLHVRRRDFKQQYSHQFFPPEHIANNTRRLLLPTLYLATDEADEGFVSRLRQGLRPAVERLVRWKDVLPVLGGNDDTPEQWHGVLEQLLCSKAEVFVGTKYSTFSAYVTRLRGYDPGVRNKNCYFTDTWYSGPSHTVPEDRPFSWGPRWRRAFWAREFPEAWEGLDEPLDVYRRRFAEHPEEGAG